MKELLKEQYEAPATKRTRVEMENGICATSIINVNRGDDVAKDRHVKINNQQAGEEIIGTTWDADQSLN